MSKEELKLTVAKLAEKYCENLVLEMNHLTMVHNSNIGRKQLGVLELLNSLAEYRLESILQCLLEDVPCNTSHSSTIK